MGLPIITTRYSTAADQIAHMEDGLIVDMNATALGEGIVRLLQDKGLASAFSERLLSGWFGTEGETEKLYRLIG
jgi:glycosyltransferase involved in cell wall biosynthesis